MSRITQAMLERAIGGASVLVQLLDKDGDGVADSTLVSEVLDDAEGEVNSAIRLAVDLSDATLETDSFLLRIQRSVAVFLAYQRGAGTHAMPRQAQADYDWAGQQLDRIARRERGLGATTQATASQEIEQVTKTDTDDWFNVDGPRRRFDGWA